MGSTKNKLLLDVNNDDAEADEEDESTEEGSLEDSVSIAYQ